MTQDPDTRLMLRFQEGDEGAFEALFKKYAPLLITFSYRFLGRRAPAEEASQEVLLRVYRSRRAYRPEARFSTWIYRIATNVCLNEVRRAEFKASQISIDASPDDEGEIPVQISDPNSPHPEEDLERVRLEEAFQKALARLPERQRAAFLLSRFKDMSYKDVSRALGCSESSVRSLIHRAAVAIREELKDFVEP